MAIDPLQKYVSLIRSFVDGRIDAVSFESRYLEMFKNETVSFDDALFEVLDALFGDVDAFCSDPAMRGGDDLDERQLLAQCQTALAKLMALQQKSCDQ